MRLKNIDLIGAILIALINVAWTQVPNRPLAVGIILALPLIFILPGYTLTQILFRKHSSSQPLDSSVNLQTRLKIGRPIGGADQVILSLGLSMAIAILVGFALNVLPMGLQGLPWALSLGLITTIMALVAAFLRRKDVVSVAKTPGPRVTLYDCILFGLAILVTTVAVWTSIIRPLQPQPSFTQFWMLPGDQVTKNCGVSIGIRNFEATPITYRVVVTINDLQTDTWSPVSLSPQGEWVHYVSVNPGIASSEFVEARLYRTDKLNTVYRDVHLTFHVSTESKDGQVHQQCSVY